MSFSPTGNKIAIVIRDGGLELFVMDLESSTMKAIKADAWSAAFVDDIQLVTVQAWSTWLNRGKLRFYNVNSGKLVREIGGTPAGIHHRVEISGDKKFSSVTLESTRVLGLRDGGCESTIPDLGVAIRKGRSGL